MKRQACQFGMLAFSMCALLHLTGWSVPPAPAQQKLLLERVSIPAKRSETLSKAKQSQRKVSHGGQARKESVPDLDSLIQHCFGSLLRISQQPLAPNFVIGDFNGDGRADALVAVVPARAIAGDDQSKTPFDFQEVLDSRSPAKVALNLKMGNLAVFQSGPLFAVMHDIARNKREPCSSSEKKFVLLFAMDKDTKTIKLYRDRKLPPGTIGDPDEDQPPPSLKGDAILLLNDRGSGTALYWDGLRYRWYPFN